MLSLLLLILRPRAVVPRDPRSIGGIGIILQHSEELHRRFRLGLQQLKQSYQDTKLASYVAAGPIAKFVVKTEDYAQAEKHGDSTALSNKKQENWQPTVLTTWRRLIAIITPLLSIAILEYIQWSSNNFNGLFATPEAVSAHYAATITPVVAMWSISALYASIHFNTILLSPYQAMSRYGATWHAGVLSHNHGRLPLASLAVSLRDMNTSACFSALGTMLGSFLTILVAGLYSISSVDIEISLAVQRTDSFNLARDVQPEYALSDSGAAQVASLVIWQNLSYPQWTYDDLVFPNLALTEAHTKEIEVSERIKVSVPARRAFLECDAKAPDYVNVSVGGNGFKYNISREVRGNCSGSIDNLYWGRANASFSGAGIFGGLGTVWVPSYFPDCASLAFYYGSLPKAHPDALPGYNISLSDTAQITTLICTQYIQELDVTLSLLPPGGKEPLGIDLDRAPIPHEETTRIVNTGTADTYNVSTYKVWLPLETNINPMTNDKDALNRLQAFPKLHEFYQTVLQANGGLDPRALTGRENSSRLIKETSKMYGRYMAQAMDRNMRSTKNLPSLSERTLWATLTQPETRLFQNSGPKVALQILLGLMSACAIAGWLTMRNTKFLPHELGSIAGVATLVAGSGLWGDAGIERGRRAGPLVPDGAEWMNDEELVKACRWDDENDGVLFGFGPRVDGTVGVNVLHRRYTVEMEGQGQGSLDDRSYEMVSTG
ncbi:hypothetical protein PG993_003804 [Apiospora rasikravindrae]|uniref:Uncharacterized protein n=1 Tax=Apiospora rasikravindrae TaxID=990691 RepID=A0ABR1U0J7_9PEZI